MIYGGRGTPIDNAGGQKEKNKQENAYKCNKVGHLAKDCRSKQKMKNGRIQEDSDKENNNKKEGFVRGLE